LAMYAEGNDENELTVGEGDQSYKHLSHPSGRGVLFGDTSIHGLAAAGVETANSLNHNKSSYLCNAVIYSCRGPLKISLLQE